MSEATATLNAQSLIGGEWRDLDGKRYEVRNPANNELLAEVAMGNVGDVADVVSRANAAFKTWSKVPLSKRIHFMMKYRELLERDADAIAELITREHGKTFAESRGDIQRGIEVVELCCGANRYLAGENNQEIASNIDANTWREPIGVCVGITPFNFPAMVPMWMFPIAIVSGNSFILKPSEKVPLTACKLAELATEAGLPDGVLNVLHGERDVVEALCSHESVAAVSFVGSTAVAEKVYQNGTRNGKRVQAAGGAKNALVVLDDADMDSTVRNVIGAAYGCSGQRCMAASLVIAVGDAGDRLANALCTAIDKIKVCDASTDKDAGMGPLINQQGKNRVLEGIECGIAEGATLLRDGRETVNEGNFVGATLLDHVQPQFKVAQEEWFGPLLCIMRAKDLDEAIAWLNTSEYGNGAVIFTQNGGAARAFARDAQCGMIGINVGVPAALAPYAFSGRKRSFFGDLHVQGQEGFLFYTQQKLILSRWDDGYKRSMGW